MLVACTHQLLWATNSRPISRNFEHKTIKRIHTITHTHQSSLGKVNWLISHNRCANIKSFASMNGKHFWLQNDATTQITHFRTDSCDFVRKFNVSKHSILMLTIIASFTSFFLYLILIRLNTHRFWDTTSESQLFCTANADCVRLGTLGKHTQSTICLIKPNKRYN